MPEATKDSLEITNQKENNKKAVWKTAEAKISDSWGVLIKLRWADIKNQPKSNPKPKYTPSNQADQPLIRKKRTKIITANSRQRLLISLLIKVI